MNSEWLELLHRLLKEPHLLNTRLTLDFLARAVAENRIVVRRKGYMIISCTILWTVPDDEWFELGTIWVDKRFRGNGLCKEMFRECIEKRRGHSLFLITSLHCIKTLASKFGWAEESEDWTTVPLWKRIADPWGDRYPANSNIKAPGKLYYRF